MRVDWLDWIGLIDNEDHDGITHSLPHLLTRCPVYLVSCEVYGHLDP